MEQDSANERCTEKQILQLPGASPEEDGASNAAATDLRNRTHVVLSPRGDAIFRAHVHLFQLLSLRGHNLLSIKI